MGWMPTAAMLLVQIGFTGMNLMCKMSLDNGMSPYVLIAYRSLMAAGFLAPFALFFQRNMWMLINKQVAFQIFVSSFLGMTVSELLFFVGFKSTSPTVACAIGNMVPALTFVLAAALFFGIVGWGITFAVMRWCIQVRDPLFVSMFSPVALVVVGLLGWAFLDEKLHLGSAIGLFPYLLLD
ncbi:WAT1-related protein At1g09380-like [Lolium perenne]|uniref:WAT1-related protein At1g09380-like n=1 Tax=Lolium perenne TaxID=4522 RepID=UPI0021F6699E|nr:WAT1-related protein At1g09380-like [Lolium perenne]